MSRIAIRATFAYTFALIRRLPPAPPGRTWNCCASYPDADVKHIWISDYPPLGQ